MQLWKLNITINSTRRLPVCFVEAEDAEKAEFLGRRLVGGTLNAVEDKDRKEKRDGISMCKYDHTMSLAQLYDTVVVTVEPVITMAELLKLVNEMKEMTDQVRDINDLLEGP